MTDNIKEKWNARHATASAEGEPVAVLKDYAHLLPQHGQALDLACGRGRNSLFLAQQGLVVDAWDISDVAITQLAQQAQSQGLPIKAVVRDVVSQRPAEEQYDVIVVGYFLERGLAPAIIASLKPKGLLFYQTFSQVSIDDNGPANPAFRLAPNELLRLFEPLSLLLYREEGRQGDTSQGLRNVAQLIAQKVV